PWVVEYNCRFGDPEVQPLLFGLRVPLQPRLLAAARGGLADEALPGDPAATVVLASAGYPQGSRAGDRITGLEALAGQPDVKVFHAGTARRGDDWVTAGGRVLGVCARGDTLAAALDQRRQAAADGGDADTERTMTLRWVRLQLDAGQVDPARELLAAWTDRDRKDAEALQLLRTIDTAAERWDVVAKTCARLVAVETGDGQADAALALAEACTHLGRLELARPGLEHARRKQPEHRGIRQALAQVYEATGAGSDLARLLTQEAEETEEPGPRLELLRRAAHLHIQEAETELALPLIRQVLELAPDDLVSSVLLIDAHMSLGELDEAEAAIEAAIEATGGRRSPELSALLHRKARIAGARGEHHEQLALMQQAFSTDKNNGQAAAELADLAEALEEWDLAVKVLRTITVLDECPISRVEAFLRQAKIAFHRGDRQRAVLWARKARQEAPEDEDVMAFLAELGEG
ncbi:MAG: tetratricopeptide repeat protein, partial [Myxococcales bacterium]|nr:tetratricopeptide repeat protein [Myxococcales bacterium]